MTQGTASFFQIAAGGRVNTPEEWHGYFEAFHAQLPHANELFTLMCNYGGLTSYRVLAEAAAASGPRTVLDLGCGDGNLIEELLDVTDDRVRIDGIDISEAEIAIAANRYAGEERVALRVADARSLPYEAASFDCVVAHQFLNLFPDIAGVRSEAERVLRPGRTLSFVANRGWRDDQTATWMVLHHAAMDVIKQQYPNFVWPRMGDMRIYTEDGIREIFAESGAWDVETLSMQTFNTMTMMTPDRVAAFYNRLYVFGTAPPPLKDGILSAVEARGRELAQGDLLEIELPFRLVTIARSAA
ncbi:MAG TPA: class I SAM-dependent methyltransferase [Candidatus Baltobacteraceae bacterium]|jgi:ubiquinone/menaquinone biosynthesis C-methylase UbiE|nr:class I SAM-dependent methyltransferase [Candidatus Baltobacteraceae bacterium]